MIKCINCEYFMALSLCTGQEILGECRRYPPTSHPNGENEYGWGWPMLFANEFCGEFTQRNLDPATHTLEY